MPYQSIFTPNSQKNFSSDFKPGQYAKVNATIAKKNQQQQNPLLNSPTPKPGGSLFSKISKVAKVVGKDAESTVKAVGRPVKDVVTGKGGKAVHDTAQLSSDVTGGSVNQFVKAARYTPQMVAADVSDNPKAQKSTQKKAFGTTKSGDIAKKIIGSTAGTAALFVGGGEAKGASEGGKILTKELLTKEGAIQAAKEVAPHAIKSGIAGGVGNEGALLSQHPDASEKELGKAGLEGVAAGVALPVAGKLFGLGAEAALSKLKGAPQEAERASVTGMKDVMTPELADKAAAAVYTKITPKDESAGAEEVGVKTPVHPGIKQQSTTYKIGVKTPTHAGIKDQSATYNVGVRTKQAMTDEQYTKEFNSLSNAYDKELKSVEGKPDVTQKALAGHIDNKYQVLINDLNDRYKNGYMSESTPAKKVVSETSSTKTVSGKAPAPKKIASETSKAEKPTGGAPKSGVNVSRSSKYNLSGARRVAPVEAEQKLQSAGYTPDETKTILQDALPEKPLSMPGTKPKVGLNDESVQKAAENLDKSNGETIPESSNLRPLEATPESEKGVSKLGSSVQEGALHDKLISKAESEDLPTYNKANLKEQAQFVSELVKSDPERAINIALGKEEAPAHILPQMVYNGVEEYARHIGGEDGGKLLLDLSKSKQVTNLTTMAQNVRAAAERDPHSPTNMINEVAVARASKVKGGAEAVTKAVKDDAKAVKTDTPKINSDDWKDFVDGLRC